MDFIKPEIRITGDGSPTLVCPGSGETYHSVIGAVEESLHVFIRNGFDACRKEALSVLECGFGSGLNAWLTARAARSTGRRVRYIAVELNPVDPSVFVPPHFPDDDTFRAIHSGEWGRETVIDEWFSLTKLHRDLAGMVFDSKFDLVYFDMFAPDSCPHLWTREVFANVGEAMEPGGMLVTYSAKGDVKRALRSAGFDVERLPGAPGKRHMLRATKL